MSEWAKDLWEPHRVELSEWTPEQERAHRERRMAYIVVGQHDLIRLFTGWIGLTFEGLPEGARVFAVDYDWTRMGFRLAVCHPSFEPVPVCNELPCVGMCYIHVDGREMRILVEHLERQMKEQEKA